MLIKEYRIPMPFTTEEYQIGQLYSLTEANIAETGGGEGVQVITNEPFENFPLFGDQYSEGQYTKKRFHLASKIPSFIRMLAPKGYVELEEETWYAYPYTRTVITNPNCMKANFSIIVESLHCPDKGGQENALGLPPDKLSHREVIFIDIAADLATTKDYQEETDPSKVRSNKFNRGPLITGKWQETAKHLMTCYKVVTVNFKWLGLQGRVENFIHRAQRRIFTNFHRQIFCTSDEWHGMTLEDIRELEDKLEEHLEKLRRTGDPRGMMAATD